MKKVIYYLSGILLMGAGVIFMGQLFGLFSPKLQNIDYDQQDMSNVVKFGQAESPYIVLSESFAKQLFQFSYTIGGFDRTTDFLSLSNNLIGTDALKIVVMKNGQAFFTVTESPLPADFSYGAFLENAQKNLSNFKILPAVFGGDSYYYTDTNRATVFLKIKNSLLSFSYQISDFAEIRQLISALLTLS